MKVTSAISPGSATSYSDSIKTEFITLESVVYVKYSALPLSYNESAKMWVQTLNDLNPVGQLWKMLWFPCPPSFFIFTDRCHWLENTSPLDVFSLNNEEQAVGSVWTISEKKSLKINLSSSPLSPLLICRCSDCLRTVVPLCLQRRCFVDLHFPYLVAVQIHYPNHVDSVLLTHFMPKDYKLSNVPFVEFMERQYYSINNLMSVSALPCLVNQYDYIK